EFHYWITGLIAKEAGFTEADAKIIAYASEYVDENDVSYTIQNRSGETTYSNFISQTMNILKPKRTLMRVYPVFHFIPGEPDAETALRRDGKMHLLNTTPNSENANTMFDLALHSSHDIRLYRIGIATHAYVDTWAHQNFVGWYDYFNNIGIDPKPDIGHADAEHHPDYVSHRWIDSRLVQEEISNRDRFLSAAQTLFFKYCSYQKSSGGPDHTTHWGTLEKQLVKLMGPTYTGSKNRYQKARLARYKAQISWLEAFDERTWFDAAIETEVNGLPDTHQGLTSKFTLFKDDFFWREDQTPDTTDWYKFQEAVKEHESDTLQVLSKTYQSIGIKLPKS
ncbi:MAG: hypothetical protein HN455_02545, partial [Gammaproteobacteria bacterium]|nr:hypothetical protein [Gammaproteobacteria bacterium]MBT4300104.1 hypothetical protein [Gammaproteobacteria bacterium]